MFWFFRTEVDKYSNTLFVSVTKGSVINVIAVDIAGGRQSLHSTLLTSNSAGYQETSGKYSSLLLMDWKLTVGGGGVA